MSECFDSPVTSTIQALPVRGGGAVVMSDIGLEVKMPANFG
jgi:hypothetical protein